MRTMGGSRAKAVVVALALVAAVGSALGQDPGRAATACESTFAAARCGRLLDAAAEALHVDPSEVVAVEIVPPPTPQTRSGGATPILWVYGGATPIFVRLRLAGGASLDTALCGGIPSGPACADEPHLDLVAATLGGGYHDTPAEATPMPTIDPRAAAAAQPIRLASMHIPIDHAGAYRITVGTGSLPNGILTESRFALADDWPAGVTIARAEVRLLVESTADGGRPFFNVYVHGWHDGVEPIAAALEFEVVSFTPGAALDVRDVVVR